MLAELNKIRLQRNEDASAFCLRLVELIEDLELVPGNAAVYLTDTQKLGYLLLAIRHKSGLQSVYSQLQSEQLRGTISFDQACQELHHRVESMKTDDLLDGRSGRALISTDQKKKGQQLALLEKVLCLAKDCKELIQPYLPLCKLCYLQSMAGKITTLALRDNFGNAVFNAATKRLDFPSTVPQSRFPRKNMKKGKALMTFVPGLAKLSHEERLRLFLNRLEGAEKAIADAAFLDKYEPFGIHTYVDSSSDGVQDRDGLLGLISSPTVEVLNGLVQHHDDLSRYNLTPRTDLDGCSPHDLVYGSRECSPAVVLSGATQGSRIVCLLKKYQPLFWRPIQIVF